MILTGHSIGSHPQFAIGKEELLRPPLDYLP
jgi:hypothetical protein